VKGRALLAVSCALASACTHTVTVKDEDPTALVILDGQELGAPGNEGVPADVRRGIGPIPYEVHGTDGSVAFGTVERTESVWWILALAGGGAACCAPSLAFGGFLIANPVILAAPLVLVTGDVGVATRAFVSPAWLTLPAMGLCGTVGLAPLAGVFFAEDPPDVMTLPAPAAAAPPAPAVAMRF
jgi:hypothetical protein